MLIQRVKKFYFVTYHYISGFVDCFLIKKILKKSFHFAVVHENEDERSSGQMCLTFPLPLSFYHEGIVFHQTCYQ